MEYKKGWISIRNISKYCLSSIEKHLIGLREIWWCASLHTCVRGCEVLLGVAYNFHFRAGWPVSRCDISEYTCYYQCKCGGLKNTNSGACTLKKKEVSGGGSEPSLPDVAQLNKEVLPSEMKKNDTAFHLVTGVKMFYSKWNRKQMALQPPDQWWRTYKLTSPSRFLYARLVKKNFS